MALTKKQEEIIHDNLKSYLANFGYIKIESGDDEGFYVYTSEAAAQKGDYVQYCYNIDYLNGWLYGAVQAANGRMKKIKKVEDL